MTIYRFAILAGVSSDKQAEENKRSIPDQIKDCRVFIEKTPGSFESAGPFIMDGYSRTGYDSLEIAMADIPPLADAIHAASNNKYDVLLVENFDRLGDLGRNVLVRFNKYKKQIYSVKQSGRLYDPATYDPADNDTASMEMGIQQIIQAYRIHKLRRGWNVGMPARIENGLPPGRVPLGYTNVGKEVPPIKNDDAIKVLEMKDMFLGGMSVHKIGQEIRARYNLRSGFSWEGIKNILTNPFYAGNVSLFKYKVDGDKKVARPKSEWLVRPGLHEPLWDDATHKAILAEFERRENLHARNDVTYPLRGLFKCSQCQATMVHQFHRGEEWLVCRPDHHIGVRYDQAIKMLSDRLRKDVEGRKINPPDKSKEIAAIQTLIDQADARRKKVQEGYEANLYTAKEAFARLSVVEEDIDRLKRKKESLQERDVLLHNFEHILETTDFGDLENWIRHADPAQVNKLLTSLIKMGVVHRGRTKYIKYIELEYWL